MSHERAHRTVEALTGEELLELLTAAAGPPDSTVAVFLDADFESLGYDSLARHEAAALVQARYGIRIHDDVVSEARTPREMLDRTNEALRTSD